MTAFLALPEASPPAELLAALVRAGDALAAHGDLLPPNLAAALFNMTCHASHFLIVADVASAGPAREAIATAARR